MSRHAYTMQVLQMLLKHGPLSATQIAEYCGMDMPRSRDAIANLLEAKCLSAFKLDRMHYAITPKGRYRLNPKEDPEYESRRQAALKKRRAKNQRYRVARLKDERIKKAADALRVGQTEDEELQFVHRIVTAPMTDDMVAAAAIHARPVLQAIWN